MQPTCYPRHQFPTEMIRHAVWLYPRFTLSYRAIGELLAERDIETCYRSIRRWVLKFGPAFAQNFRRLSTPSRVGVAAEGLTSIQAKFAVDGAQVRWSKQGLVGDPHAVERSLKVGTPERQELVELGKAWSQIILLPDELLQDRAVVGHAVENAGRGQAIALQLTSKVARHHRAPQFVLASGPHLSNNNAKGLPGIRLEL